MSAATSLRDSHETSFEALLVSRLPDLLPDHPRVASIVPITAPGGIHPNIRRVTLSTGERLIAKRHLFASLKHGEPNHLLTVERTVSDLFGGNGVPEFVAAIDDAGISLVRDVGSRTLDDVVQTASPVGRALCCRRTLGAFVDIQKTLLAAELERRLGERPRFVQAHHVQPAGHHHPWQVQTLHLVATAF